MTRFSLFIHDNYARILDVEYKTDLMSLFFENLGVLKIYRILGIPFYELS